MQILTMSQWETRVADFKASAICFKLDFDAYLAMRDARIYAELNRKHGARAVYSAYMKGFVYGLLRAADMDIQQNHTEFCYVENGILFSTHRASTHRSTEEFYSANRGAELGKLPSGSFWIGTDRPHYFKGD